MSEIEDYQWPQEELFALKAAWQGKADPAMQRRVIAHIVEVLCRYDGSTFVPGQPDLTAWFEGRRWIGRQIKDALTLPADRIIKEEPDGRNDTDNASPITATERARRRLKMCDNCRVVDVVQDDEAMNGPV